MTIYIYIYIYTLLHRRLRVDEPLKHVTASRRISPRIIPSCEALHVSYVELIRRGEICVESGGDGAETAGETP